MDNESMRECRETEAHAELERFLRGFDGISTEKLLAGVGCTADGPNEAQDDGPVWLRSGGQHEGVKFDQGKRRVDLVPAEVINALADVLTAGADKYGEHNWRHGMDWHRVYGAAQRHLLAFWAGDDIDQESGMPHLWHALTNIAFLVSYQALGLGYDDRWVLPEVGE